MIIIIITGLDLKSFCSGIGFCPGIGGHGISGCGMVGCGMVRNGTGGYGARLHRRWSRGGGPGDDAPDGAAHGLDHLGHRHGALVPAAAQGSE